MRSFVPRDAFILKLSPEMRPKKFRDFPETGPWNGNTTDSFLIINPQHKSIFHFSQFSTRQNKREQVFRLQLDC